MPKFFDQTAVEEWEEVYHNGYSDTYRMKVCCGWIYRSREWGRNENIPCTVALVFVPDTRK